MKYTRIYNLNKLEDFEDAEKLLNKILNKYEYVRVIQVGIDEIRIAYM